MTQEELKNLPEDYKKVRINLYNNFHNDCPWSLELYIRRNIDFSEIKEIKLVDLEIDKKNKNRIVTEDNIARWGFYDAETYNKQSSEFYALKEWAKAKEAETKFYLEELGRLKKIVNYYESLDYLDE